MSYCKKTEKVYIWLAVDHNRQTVVDFEVTTRRGLQAYLPLAQCLKPKYRIEIARSNCYEVYDKYHLVKQHYFTKTETALVDSFNALIRHYLA